MYEHKKEMATQVNLSTRILSSNNIKNKSDDIMMSRERNARYFSSAPVPSYLALIACPPELPQQSWKIPTLLGVKECTHTFNFPFSFPFLQTLIFGFYLNLINSPNIYMTRCQQMVPFSPWVPKTSESQIALDI